jgi:hypothetical protein
MVASSHRPTISAELHGLPERSRSDAAEAEQLREMDKR